MSELRMPYTDVLVDEPRRQRLNQEALAAAQIARASQMSRAAVEEPVNAAPARVDRDPSRTADNPYHV